MDLSTDYLGLHLPHPLMPGASPLVDDLDTVKRLEDAGAAAIVMHSLFEEQFAAEQFAADALLELREEAFSEALSYLPGLERFRLDADEYLEQLRRIKETVALPVVASLNGTSPGGWLRFAGLLQEAGADALELNVYELSTDPDESSATIEARVVEMLAAVKREVRIPVAVKLSPYYTALAHFAQRLDAAGADGLVLFNRFYQPDVDVDEREVVHRLSLSDPAELLLRLRWLAILSDRVGASLAVTGGVHSARDAIKALMTGAHAVQIVSALLRQGPQLIGVLRRELAEWLEEHEYESLAAVQGMMNLARCPDPKTYERANYLELLHSRGR